MPARSQLVRGYSHDLPAPIWDRLEEVLESFEDSWRSGVRPDLSAYLPAAEPERQALLIELIHAELHYRFAAGEAAAWKYTSSNTLSSRESQSSSELDPRGVLSPTGTRAEYTPGQIPRGFPEWASQLEGKLGTAITPDFQSERGSRSSEDDGMSLDMRGYELLERVGRGGMGEVFRGKDPALGRDLAVKVLREALCGNAEAEHRLEQEARITGGLQHPNIVPVHNLGRLPDGRLYFTMKLVRGRTLAEILSDGREEKRLPEFLGHFEKICQAVAFAHSRGVIHRDLKPLNVMVGAFGEVQVMDWGLAKVLQSAAATGLQDVAGGGEDDSIRHIWRTSSTVDDYKTGVVGTYGYMPPEQARATEDIDKRADVFGLGAILCEILTGKPPVSSQCDASDGNVTAAMVRLNSCGADKELVALCRECLAAERAERPRYGKAVAERVLAYQAGVQERLRKAELERVKAEAEAREQKKRRRVQLFLAIVIGIMILAGLVTIGNEQLKTARERDEKVLALHDSEQQRDRAVEARRRTARGGSIR